MIPHDTWLAAPQPLPTQYMRTCRSHDELEAHCTAVKNAGWPAAQVVYQLFMDRSIVFVDFTSWASAAADTGSSLRVLVSETAKRLEEGASAFPAALLGLFLEQTTVVETHVPRLRPLWPEPRYVRPYFDIDLKLRGENAAQILWDALEWEPAEWLGVPVMAAHLPPLHARFVSRILAATADVLHRAYPTAGVHTETPGHHTHPRENWRVTIAFRKSKCSMHVVWTGCVVRATGDLLRALNEVVGHGSYYARCIDRAVYRVSSDVSFQYRACVCPSKNPAQRVGGTHLPLLPDGRVFCPRADMPVHARRLFAVAVARDMAVQQAGPLQPVDNPFTAQPSSSGLRTGLSGLSGLSGRRPSKTATTQMQLLCPHIQPGWDVTKVIPVSNDMLILRVSPNGCPRTCHMDHAHNGQQDYMAMVFRDGRVKHKCFANGRMLPCCSAWETCDAAPPDAARALFELYSSGP